VIKKPVVSEQTLRDVLSVIFFSNFILLNRVYYSFVSR
jgi:hypothetical protein